MVDAVLQRYVELFEGRLDQYALGGPDKEKPWKYRYNKIERPLTPDVIRTHIDGAETIGVYCEREGLSKWFALDFDSPKDENNLPVEGGFEVALAEAAKFRQELQRNGLFGYLERSRSGHGVHVWGFVDEWADSRALAAMLHALEAPLGFATVDRGKRYPPLKASTNGVLICLPYAGEAVESGNSMFLSLEAGADYAEMPLEEFLAQVRVNKLEAVRRVMESAPSSAKAAVAPRTREATAVGGISTPGWEGRPDRLGTGILKMLSPFGCNFMRQVWLQQDDRRVVGEPEWYAFLGQLSAFKYGREAAHSIFKVHKRYDARGMNEKYDHAAANPPVGCAHIHATFPQFTCDGCPLTAPYRKGYQSIPQLCGESPQELERALYDQDLERIRRLDASENPEGISTGIPGIDHLLRFKLGEFTAIGAQPSIGKTALMVHMMNTIAPTGVDVAAFSAESGVVSVHDRQIAHRAGVDSYALKGLRMRDGKKERLSREEWKLIEEATHWLNQQSIWENYTTSSPERIYDAVEAMLCKRDKPLTHPALVLFDYFQYAQGSDQGKAEDEHVRLARASFMHKSIAKIIEQPFVDFAQLIRESEGDEDPKINWWRGTARLEHDIDNGLIVTGIRMPGRHAPRVIHSVKQREGQVGWKQELLLEQATSRWESRGGPAQALAEKERLHDEPWEGAAGQLSMVKPGE